MGFFVVVLFDILETTLWYINNFNYKFPFLRFNPILMGFPGGSDGKEFACNAGDLGLMPGLGRSPGEGNGYPHQYSCLENPMDRGAWWATVHGSQRVSHNERDSVRMHALTQPLKKRLWLSKSFLIKTPKYFMLTLIFFLVSLRRIIIHQPPWN